MVDSNPTKLIITLNVYGLNTHIKRQTVRLDKTKAKTKGPTIHCLQETHFKYK